MTARRFLVALALVFGLAWGQATSAADTLATGTFVGASDHITTGGVSVVSNDGVVQIVLADDFSLDGAPDPRVGLGNAGGPATRPTLRRLAEDPSPLVREHAQWALDVLQG